MSSRGKTFCIPTSLSHVAVLTVGERIRHQCHCWVWAVVYLTIGAMPSFAESFANVTKEFRERHEEHVKLC